MTLPNKTPQCKTTKDHPFFVSLKTPRTTDFKGPTPELWQIYCEELAYTVWTFGTKVHSFALLPEQLLLILTSSQNTLPTALSHLQTSVLGKTSRLSKVSKMILTERYRAKAIDSGTSLKRHYKLLYRAPVEAGLCKRCEDYPYSSIQFLVGLQWMSCPLERDRIMESDFDRTLNWLNQESQRINSRQWHRTSSSFNQRLALA